MALPFLNQLFPWLMFIMTLVLTFSAAHLVQRSAERDAQREIDAHADSVTQAIRVRLNTVEQLLYGSAGFIGTVPEIRRKTWRSYVGRLDLDTRHRDLLGVGYVQWVLPDELEKHDAAMRADEAPQYRVYPSGQRQAYAPVVQVEPSTQANLDTIGYDMLSDPVSRKALLQARDTGTVAVTMPMPLARESGEPSQPGVMLFLPVYRDGMPHADVSQRRAALTGFVYTAFQVGDLLATHFPGGFPDTDIDLFDAGAPLQSAKLFRADALARHAGSDHAPAFTVDREIMLHGQVWALRVSSRAYADVVSPRFDVLPILACGTTIALLLFFVTWSIAVSRRRVLTLAQDMTAALQASEGRVRLIADNIPALVAYTSPDRRFVFGNRRYQDAFGADHKKLVGMRTRDVIGDDAYEQSEHYIESVLKGEYSQFERSLHYNGVLRWERVSYVPDVQPDGTVAGFFSLVEDITELKQIQSTLADNEQRLRTITENLPAMIAYIDTDMRYRFCNNRYRTFIGYRDRRLLGLTVQEAVHPETYRSVGAYMQNALQGNAVTFERHVTEVDPPRYLHYDYVPDRSCDGRVLGFYTMIIDITERKEAELKQAASETMLRGVTDHLPALVSFVDRDGRFLFNNAPYEQWLNRPLAEITGSRVVDVYDRNEYEIFKPVVQTALTGTLAQQDFELVKLGEHRYYRITSVPQFSDNGDVYGVCNMITDITAIKHVEMRLSEMARTDSLTSLPNRNAINEKLAEAVARSRRNAGLMAVMYLDLDRFKSINDTYGHYCGDRVLMEFARRLQAAVRLTDIVGRLAGDEFVIIIEGLKHVDESTFIAEKIVRAMQSPFSIDGVRHQVSTSIGIAIRQKDETDVQRLLKRADEALYQAKGAGRNQFVSLL